MKTFAFLYRYFFDGGSCATGTTLTQPFFLSSPQASFHYSLEGRLLALEHFVEGRHVRGSLLVVAHVRFVRARLVEAVFAGAGVVAKK